MMDHMDLQEATMPEEDREALNAEIDAAYDEYLYNRWVETYAPIEREF